MLTEAGICAEIPVALSSANCSVGTGLLLAPEEEPPDEVWLEVFREEAALEDVAEDDEPEDEAPLLVSVFGS